MKRSTLSKNILSAALLATIAAGVRAEAPTISGFVDVGYNYNLNKQMVNDLRSFDDKSNTITLQNAEVDMEGKVGDRSSYRVDLMYGYDATKTHAAGFDQSASPTPSNLQIDVQQAYLTFPCPLTGAALSVGKFVTPFGVEVIEAKDDYNISRGLLFNYAIPFTHTGVKWDKGFAEGKYTATVGLVNGWDSMQDNNTGKTIIAQAGTTVLPKTKLVLGGAYGPEQAGTTPSTGKNNRSLVDAIVTVTPTDALTLIANVDYGVEGNLPVSGSDNTTQNWTGLGLHANYAINNMFSVAARYENLDDEGSRTSLATASTADDIDGSVLQSGTLTVQAKKENILYRLEYRQDQSSKKVFVKSDGTADDTQSAIGAQIIYTF